MIRSDYLCKRTITLEYILYFCIIVLGVVFGTSNFEDKCGSFNTQYVYRNGNNNYNSVVNIERRDYIHFAVQECQEAHIGFASEHVTNIDMMTAITGSAIIYEIIFDIQGNSCTITKGGYLVDNATISENGTLDCKEFVEFWISYDNGMFELGRSSNLESDSFMEYNGTDLTSPHQDIHSVAIKRGKWCFFDTDNGTQTAQTEQTSSTVDSTVTPATPPPTPHEPMIMSMTPSYGPVSGGTEVNITGSFLDSITKLWLGSNHGNLMYELNFMMESGNISAVTPEYSGPEPNETGVLLNVMYNVMTVTHIQFKYKRDPHVVDIYPRKMTKSGGLTVTVEGSSLDSVAAPMLTVTAIKRSDQSQRTTRDSPCKAETPKRLLCVTPKIPEISSSTKRKRHTTDNRRRRQSNDEELDFVLGLQFDGADNYEDLTDNLPHLAHIEVHQDPSFSPDQMFSFDPEFAGAIGIKGENIDAGVVVADYNVSVGKGFCTNIGITSDKLYCNPPLTLDEVTDGNRINTTRAHNEVDITVRVGTNLVYTVGKIVYDIEETISLYTIFVPVVAALGALLVVFVIILIVCCCRKARAKKDYDKTLAPSAQDLNTLEPSRNDNYYTDETQPKNQYYMVVNQGANGQ